VAPENWINNRVTPFKWRHGGLGIVGYEHERLRTGWGRLGDGHGVDFFSVVQAGAYFPGKERFMKPYHPQAIVVPPASGKTMEFLGVTHKLSHGQTGGAYYLFEFEFDPESGNRLHMHQHEDEVVHVLEGAIEIRLGDRKLQTVAGGVALLPKRIPHALYNPLKRRSRYLGLAVPGGMENFFDELSAAQETGTLDDVTHKRISQKYGIEWLE
jgi:quercetin dioxygenase-like cupin family protein